MKKIAIILFVIFSISCLAQKRKSIPMKIENKNSILEYLSKKEIDFEKVFVVKDFETYRKLSKDKLLTIPEIMLFNNKGELIVYRDSARKCSKDATSFLEGFSLDKNYPVNKNFSLQYFLENLISLNGEKATIGRENDLYVFINWAIMADEVNDESFKLLQLQQANMNFFLINLDLQENWNLDEEVKKKLHVE